MPNKKLEIINLNKKKKEIIMKDHDSEWMTFWHKNNKTILSILLILLLIVIGIATFYFVPNLLTTDEPLIKEVSIDVSIPDNNIALNPNLAMTDETAENSFKNKNIFKSEGALLVTNTIETSEYIIRFYSDYTAIKILKHNNFITRINSIGGNNYGISQTGVINTKAIINDITQIDTKTYSWGEVHYYSDGGAQIVSPKVELFVRNSEAITENYFLDSQISQLKNTKKIANITLNYYYDGTIEVIKDNKSYIVRDASDLNITSNNVTFKNNNEATIVKTETLNGNTINYYSDGGAIIKQDNKMISIRKSNSISIKDNKLYDIVDNIYITVSAKSNDDNITYYNNGSAIVKNYQGQTVYVEDSSTIIYKNNKISKINGQYQVLTNERNIGTDKVLTFNANSFVQTKEYTAIVPNSNILYNSDGSVKTILENSLSSNDSPIKISNNTNNPITYRIVIEKSNKTTMDTKYIKYQLSNKDTYIKPTNLETKIWNTDKISNSLSVTGINYILIENTLDPYVTDEVNVMLWIDYDTIPNSMQNKYFYGTIRVYAWQTIK